MVAGKFSDLEWKSYHSMAPQTTIIIDTSNIGWKAWTKIKNTDL
jgi:hypothetical protein